MWKTSLVIGVMALLSVSDGVAGQILFKDGQAWEDVAIDVYDPTDSALLVRRAGGVYRVNLGFVEAWVESREPQVGTVPSGSGDAPFVVLEPASPEIFSEQEEPFEMTDDTTQPITRSVSDQPPPIDLGDMLPVPEPPEDPFIADTPPALVEPELAPQPPVITEPTAEEAPVVSEPAIEPEPTATAEPTPTVAPPVPPTAAPPAPVVQQPAPAQDSAPTLTFKQPTGSTKGPIDAEVDPESKKSKQAPAPARRVRVRAGVPPGYPPPPPPWRPGGYYAPPSRMAPMGRRAY